MSNNQKNQTPSTTPDNPQPGFARRSLEFTKSLVKPTLGATASVAVVSGFRKAATYVFPTKKAEEAVKGFFGGGGGFSPFGR